MDESLDPIDRLPDPQHSDRVNPADRSNPEKKDNGFSNALKEKMKEKLKQKAQQNDEVILHDEPDDSHADHEQDEQTESQPEAEMLEPNEDEKEPAQEHIDLKA